jgi:hypothetical protein
MKRSFIVGSAAVLGLALGLGPAGAQGVSTPAATQENVRHLATVPGTTGGHVVVEGKRLYMGNYGTGLSSYDISNPRSPVKTGQYLPGPSMVEGTVPVDRGIRADAPPDAAVWDGRHIVTLGGTNRVANLIQTEFIDFTDPADPQLLYRFTAAPDAESHNGDIADARKLWLPSGGSGNSGLRIYDMSPLLESPAKAPVKVFSANPHTLWNTSPYREYYEKPVGGSFNHTHDIEVYTDREILLPEWEWEDQDEDGVPDPTYGLRDIILLAAAGGGNASGAVYVIDITDPAAPVVISKWQNPTGAGHNAISYLHEAQFLHGDPGTIFVADEDMTSGCDEGRLYTFGISEDLVHTEKLGEWAIGAGAQDLPGACAGSHVFSSHDRHVFMGAYVAGLQVLDLRDPANPTRVGRYIAEGQNSWGALYHDGVIYTGDFGGRGLDVFEFIQDPHAKAFVKAGNPTTRQTGGIAETGCRQGDADGPTNGTDGLIVTIPEEARDGTHTLRALGSSSAPYDLDVWFHGEDCASMGYPGGTDSSDAVEPIPEGAVMASIDLWVGGSQWVYVQID